MSGMPKETVDRAFAGEGQRMTRQRRAVAAAVDDLETFSSAQAVHDILKAQGDAVGLSTVYRNLQTLADVGEVDSLRNADGEVLYRKCGTTHHHHLVCRQCGRTVEVSGPSVEQWTQRTADEHGFSDVTHSLEIFGLCSACA
jgi:Fur family ferric uptake transcriptional regulator